MQEGFFFTATSLVKFSALSWNISTLNPMDLQFQLYILRLVKSLLTKTKTKIVISRQSVVLLVKSILTKQKLL